MIKFEILNSDRLRELFVYDPETGQFSYRTRAARNVQIGDVAGSVNTEGYRHIRVDGRTYKASRLAWVYMTGEWPKDMIDHVNGQRGYFGDEQTAAAAYAAAARNLFGPFART